MRKFIQALASFFCSVLMLKRKKAIPALKLCVADGCKVGETTKISPWVDVAEVVCSMLTTIDNFFDSQNLPRQQRREFWREFAKSSDTRTGAVKSFLKRLENIGRE